ncbi:unnamed protein product [Calypogeia fissa]
MELAACAMDGILDEILPAVPEARLQKLQDLSALGLREEIQSNLAEYKEIVSAKYFPKIWQGEKPNLLVMKKRANKLVYRFFLEMELKDRNCFWVYPLCFDS